MPHSGDPLKAAQAVVVSWYGVLFDRDRRALHAATRESLARWNVTVTDDELAATRGPSGRPHFERLFSISRVAEAFRQRQRRWAQDDDFETMARDLAPRMRAAAEATAEPEADAAALLGALRARGIRTAAICCAPKAVVGAQIEALARHGVALDCVVTADEAREPAPAPWALFEAQRLLGVDDPAAVVSIDDTPPGWSAARNAGARAVALLRDGSPTGDAQVVLRSLDELRRESAD